MSGHQGSAIGPSSTPPSSLSGDGSVQSNQEGGTLYNIGDGIALSAAHIFFEYNQKFTARDIVGDSDVLLDFVRSGLSTNGYQEAYRQFMTNLSDVVPASGFGGGTLYRQIRYTNNYERGSGGAFEASLRGIDMVVVNGSDNSIGSGDDGLVTFLNVADTVNMATLFSGVGYRISTKTATGSNRNADVTIRSVSTSTPVGQTFSNLVFTPPAAGGQSGGAYLLRGIGGKDFVVGIQSSSSTVSNLTTTPGDETAPYVALGYSTFTDKYGDLTVYTQSFSTYLSYDNWKAINDYLIAPPGKQAHIGNVTGNEPTNMIVGTALADGLETAPVIGSFRADIFLGREGKDVFRDDPVNGAAWGNDQLYGGEGDDIFLITKGSDFAHGGDIANYAARLALDADGKDTVNYSDSMYGTGVSIAVGDAQGIRTAPQEFRSLADLFRSITVKDLSTGGDTDFLVSVEQIEATAADDVFRIVSLGSDFLAGLDGLGGLARIDFKGQTSARGDLIDGSGTSEALKIDLRSRVSENIANPVRYVDIVGAESAYGGSGGDEIHGTAGANELKGNNGIDTIYSHGGADTIDGGIGDDTIIVEGDETLARGEIGDKIYLVEINDATQHLSGGARTVAIDDNWPYEQQIAAMRNSSAEFRDRQGIVYAITGSGETQGLMMLLPNGKVTTIARWTEGEYGIRLSTRPDLAFNFEAKDYGVAGFPVGGLASVGTLATFYVNLVHFTARQAQHSAWYAHNGYEISWNRLLQLSGQPVLPPNSGNLEGTSGDDLIHGIETDDRILAGEGNDIVKAFYGSDNLDGGDGDDILEGGLGNDVVVTGGGADTVVFQRGDGADVVMADTDDVIRLLGITPGEVTIRNASAGGSNPVYGALGTGSLVLGMDGDQITIDKGAFGSIEFADGTVWTAAGLSKAAIQGSVTAGDDVVIGGATADTLRGGAGNDYLNGGGGDDRYVFARGDGQDRLEDSDGTIADVLIFAAGIAPGDILVTSARIETGPRAGEPLIRLAISGSSDWVEFPFQDIDQVRFSDGTVWQRHDIGSKAAQSAATGGDDIITIAASPDGYVVSGTFRPGAGSDVIRAGAYGASILFGRGSGLDRVTMANAGGRFGQTQVTFDADVALGDVRFSTLGDGIAASIEGTGDRLEIVRFNEGSVPAGLRDYEFSLTIGGQTYSARTIERMAAIESAAVQSLSGTALGDTLTGGASSDRISGGAGNDVIVGDSAADLLLGGSGDDNVSGGSGRDLLMGEAGNDILSGGDDDDELIAGTGTDSLSGGVGNDTLYGNGTSILAGGIGNDGYVVALGDTVQYNVGDGYDVLMIGAGGAEAVFDGSLTPRRSEIVFGAGVLAASTTLTLDGWGVIINVNGSATDKIRLDRVFQSGNLPLLRFNDGTVWTEREVYDRIFTPNQGSADAHPITTQDPSWGSNVLAYTYGGRGNDNLYGDWSVSENRYLFAPGDGQDVIADFRRGSLVLLGFDIDSLRIQRTGSALQDFVLSFVGSTDTVTILDQQTEYGTSSISDVYKDGVRLFSSDLRTLSIRQSITDGNDLVYGFDGYGGYQNVGYYQPTWWSNPGNDILLGGLGNDLLAGGTGDDTYVIAIGDGVDTIRDLGLHDSGAYAGRDLLRLAAVSGTSHFSRDGADADDLVIAFSGSPDKVIIDEYFANGQIEEIEFGDGVVYTPEEVERLAIAGSATAGNDVVRGSQGHDTLGGGAGNDQLDGRAGRDRYVFNAGDGHDVISDSGSGEANTLAFGAGIGFAGLSFARVGSDLRIGLGANDSVTVAGQFADGSVPPIAQIVFADGTSKSWPDIVQALLDQSATSGGDTVIGYSGGEALTGGGGNDILAGGGGDDMLVGGAGDDLLDGQSGTDRYWIARGDGIDRIASTQDPTAVDSILFAEGISSRDLEFVRASPTAPDLVINLRGTAQSVTVSNYFAGTAIAAVAFADGTVLTAADIAQALANPAPTAGTEIWRPQVGEGATTFGLPSGLFEDDLGGDDLAFAATLADGSPLPAWLSFNGRFFTSNAADQQVGTYTLKIVATDRFGASADRLFKLDLVNSAEAPVAIAALATQSAAIGSAFGYTLPGNLFADEDSVFSAMPEAVVGTYATEQGGTIAVQSGGAYNYTPAAGYVGPDSAIIPFAIGTAASLERRFDFDSDGSAASGALPPDLAPKKDVVTLTARLATGDPLPAWLSFDGAAFSGTPGSGDAGPLAIEIVATDASGLASVIPLNLRVGTANAAPTASALGNAAAVEDSAFSFVLPPTAFSDSNVHDRLTLAATAVDGSPLPAWLHFDGKRFTGTPDNNAVGVLTVKVTATDIFGASASANLVITTGNTNDAPSAGAPLPSQLAVQGQAFSYSIPVAAFVDPDQGDTRVLSAKLLSGASLPGWLTFNGTTLSGTPGALDTGLYTVRVKMADGSGAEAHQDILIGVKDVNDAPTVAQALAPFAAPVQESTIFKIPSGLFADVDDARPRLAVTLADGSPLPDWMTFDADFRTITFAPGVDQLFGKDRASATYQLRITATDSRGASVSAVLVATVDGSTVGSTITGAGPGTLNGSSGAERIDSGPGNHTINAGGGTDRIVFGRGYGTDVLKRESATVYTPLGDIVEFGPNITLADLTFTRVDDIGGNALSAKNLLITINGTTDSLRIERQFGGYPDEEATAREFRFADGSRLSAAEVVAMFAVSTSGNDTMRGSHLADTLSGGPGNDRIYGFDGDDILDGGPGDDKLIGDQETHGYGGSDTFLFGRGSGNDVVFADTTADLATYPFQPQLGVDTLKFGPNVKPSDLIVTHLPGYPDESLDYEGEQAGSLLIRIAGTTDSVRIDHQFYIRQAVGRANITLGIERFEFADGTVMNRAEFEALITLEPSTSGNDLIAGGAGADRLAGGLGDDILVGEEGNDTYVYNAGDGNDVIQETQQVSRETPATSPTLRTGDIISFDTLSFGGGIDPADLVFNRSDAYGEDLIISFRNRPGQVQILGQFRNILHGETFMGPLNVVSYYGTENAAIDQFVFADGTRWSLADIYAYSMRSTSGDDVIDGFFRPAETLDGGAGNDLLVGRNGNDTYVFGRGYGNDAVKEFGYFYNDNITGFGSMYSAADKIVFKDLSSTEVTTKIGPNGSFIFTIINTGETLTILGESEFSNFTAIQFTDTTWNAAAFQSRWTLASATSGNDTLYGFVANDTLSGGDGNDVLQGGQGTDVLSGGLGNDVLIIESGDGDTADGGDGDDTIEVIRAAQFNTFSPSLERGQLSYPTNVRYGEESGTVDGGVGQDVLVLGGKLADYWGGSSYVSDNGDGSYSFQYGLSLRNIERIRFADGEVALATLAEATVPLPPNPVEGTSGNDVMNGTAGADGLMGLAGSDTLNGHGGDDVLRGGPGTDSYDGGTGFDIYDASDDSVAWSVDLVTNKATQGATIENLIGIEGAYGSTAADTLTGNASANLFRGYGGDDTISGGDGDDIVEVLGSEEGFDAVTGGLGNDTIRALGDYSIIGLRAISGVETVTANGFQSVGLMGSAGADTLDLSATTLIGIETIDGGAGADTITGTAANDTIIGGSGDDILSGGLGDDVFQKSGSGSSSGFDRIDGGGGNDVVAATGNSASIGLTSVTGVETITSGGFSNVSILGSASADTLDFTSVTLVGITRIDGGSGADIITGSAAADTIVGGSGDDVLGGGSGDDVFQVSGSSSGFDRLDGGLGNDTIRATAASTVIGLASIAGIETITANGFANVSIGGSAVADTLDFTSVALTGITKIDGGAGNDAITGSAAADTILGSGGDDILNGGGGDDVFQVTGTTAGFDRVDGGGGTDTIQALAASTVIGLISLTGVETITAGGFSGVYVSGSTANDTLSFASTTLIGITRIDGGSGNDTIDGSAAADTIVGGIGDDSIAGGAGNDSIDGGTGNDIARFAGNLAGYQISSGGGVTTVTDIDLSNGNGGTDQLTGIESIVFADAVWAPGLVLTGTTGADTLTGAAGPDQLSGLGGNDILWGGGSDDVLIGGDGDDQVNGEAGNDTIQVSGTTAGFDRVDGGTGTDTIQAMAGSTVIGLSFVTGVETITAGAFSGVWINGSASADTLDFSATTLTGITRIDAGAGNDVITGSAAADTILGSGGDDRLVGGGGNDVFQVTGTTAGFDNVDGGAGTDTIQAMAASTVIGLTAVAGIETITAGAFTGVYISGSSVADTLDFTSTTLTAIARIDGGAGNDTLIGSAGNDVMLGSAGNDALTGGGGSDTFQYTGAANGFDSVDGGSGTDTISATAANTVIGLTSVAGIETISAGALAGVSIAGSGNNDNLNFTGITLTAITKIDGGAGADTIIGSAGVDTILGSAGDDTLSGAGGNDAFQYSGAANGFDAVDGGAGTDTISATVANTVIGLSSVTGIETITAGALTGVTIAGSGGNDVLTFTGVTLTAIVRVDGGAGNDTITGNTAVNTLWGGLGNDTLSGDAGNDSLVGDDGDDILIGGAGNDALNGAAGIDTVDYSAAAAAWTVNLSAASAQGVSGTETDTISNVENVIGGAGADIITGTTAANNLKGSGGNDRITGGFGNDTIDGGLGTDVAVFAGLQASYSIVTGGGTIQIVDNQPTTDGNDGTDTLTTVEKAEFKGGVQVALAAPIVLDLDGDGVELIDNDRSSARFDWDGDGVRDETGWVGEGDGLLVYDRNGDGSISGANELSFLDDKPGAKSDLDGLSAFDSNGDGLFSANDSAWSGFGVWKDKDQDGKADAGEFVTMSQAGIASISLAGTATARSWAWGDNIVINTGGFTRADGSSAQLADVALNYSTKLSPTAQAQPEGGFAGHILGLSSEFEGRLRVHLMPGDGDERGDGRAFALAEALERQVSLTGGLYSKEALEPDGEEDSNSARRNPLREFEQLHLDDRLGGFADHWQPYRKAQSFGGSGASHSVMREVGEWDSQGAAGQPVNRAAQLVQAIAAFGAKKGEALLQLEDETARRDHPMSLASQTIRVPEV